MLKSRSSHIPFPLMAIRALKPQYPFTPFVRCVDRPCPYPSPLLGLLAETEAKIGAGELSWRGLTGKKAAKQFSSHVDRFVKRNKYRWEWTLSYWHDPEHTLSEIIRLMGLDSLIKVE